MEGKAKNLGTKILIVIGIVVLAFILVKLVFNGVGFVIWLALIGIVALGILWLVSMLKSKS